MRAPGFIASALWAIILSLNSGCLSPAYAQSPAPALPPVSVGTWAGPMGYFADGAKKPVAFARVSLVARAAPFLYFGAQLNMWDDQVGATIPTIILPQVGEVPDPRHVPDLEGRISAFAPLVKYGDLGCGPAVVVGYAFANLEGNDSPQLKQWTQGIGARCGDETVARSLYLVYLKRYDADPTAHVGAGLQWPIRGDVSVLAEGALGEHRVYKVGLVIGRQGNPTTGGAFPW